eukprot:UN04777
MIGIYLYGCFLKLHAITLPGFLGRTLSYFSLQWTELSKVEKYFALIP